MEDDPNRTESTRRQIHEEYGIELDDAHLNSVMSETDRILKVARTLQPSLSFDQEPGDFPASLARLRDSS
ncbi:MAG: hypothetical protein CL569_02630 [Alphaproteobacteria bacterium]|nr:hypothetical protein [Alphaproteobacteria bacterium]|tara:strand:- start:2457 stop:2666 length:210 start_codon:yes stop_codon:yes gene_type:complete